jgi:hypothetical protein
MGDSTAWERLEGRSGPPTFAELFSAAHRQEYRRQASELVSRLDLSSAEEIHLRRKLAEAARTNAVLKRARANMPKFWRLQRLMRQTELASQR